MKKLLTWLSIILFFGDAGMMFAIDRLAMPGLAFAGLVLFGLVFILTGQAALSTPDQAWAVVGLHWTPQRTGVCWCQVGRLCLAV